MSDKVYTGGCQCGAVRFRFTGPPKDASICHCRMCQKAFGNLMAPLLSVRGTDFTWTRGTPKRFASSNHVLRGFCGECGTPLSYEAPDGIAIALGALDDPGQVAPSLQYGTEAKLAYFDGLHRLPGHPTIEDLEAAPFLADIINYQHPDHDTDEWPPERDR